MVLRSFNVRSVASKLTLVFVHVNRFSDERADFLVGAAAFPSVNGFRTI
jgi:hypothetical protein